MINNIVVSRTFDKNWNITWTYNNIANSVDNVSYMLRDEVLHKLLDAQVRPDNPKIIREIKYIKAKHGTN